MAQIKWALIIADLLGIPMTIIGIIENFNSVKGTLIFIASMSYLMSRMYFFIRQRHQAVRDKELDLWHKEQDKLERIEKSKNKK